MIRDALFWEKQGDMAKCNLCPHSCLIKPNSRGFCGVRENVQGSLKTLTYSSVTSAMPDPIEKKPLFHFYPGSTVYSLGTFGCTFRCLHCQNYNISQTDMEHHSLKNLSPDEAVYNAQKTSSGIAFTYNEPTIWIEYFLETAKKAKKSGLYTVFVTNGYINLDPLEGIVDYLDAANIDIKSMSNEFYKSVCKAKLEPVLEACLYYIEKGVHVELTYLIIPGHNDSSADLSTFCRWVSDNIGPMQVVHFTAFYPQYKMNDIAPTSLSTLLSAYSLAKSEGLNYVYLGNVPHGAYENSYCHVCGALLIERHGFCATIKNLTATSKCISCNAQIPIQF